MAHPKRVDEARGDVETFKWAQSVLFSVDSATQSVVYLLEEAETVAGARSRAQRGLSFSDTVVHGQPVFCGLK